MNILCYISKHKWNDWVGLCQQVRTCQRCLKKETRENHKWNDWVGLCQQVRTCQRCPKKETRENHEFTTESSKCPYCLGDGRFYDYAAGCEYVCSDCGGTSYIQYMICRNCETSIQIEVPIKDRGKVY